MVEIYFNLTRIKICENIFFTLLLFNFYLCNADGASQEMLQNIKLRLYFGKTSSDNYKDVKIGSAKELIDNIYLKNQTIIYIHGFSEGLNSESVHAVIDAHLKVKNGNVMAVGYEEIAAENYVLVAASTPQVGKAVAKAIDDLVDGGLSSKSIHLVGHSLGGQVAGYVGRYVSNKLPRITGLDPAGPLFYVVVDHLTSADAEYVVIIHTDAGFYGNAITTGDGADFYPNGGTRVQPGCTLLSVPYYSSEDFCSHHRSWYYYAESVINDAAFIGVQCDHWWKFKSNSCKNNRKVIMGYGTPNGTKGTFYLDTKSSSPFGRGKESVKPILDFW